MKTSIIEVTDLLSVLTVDEVEKRLGEVLGVASATVNYAAKNATVRYDETLLEGADIKILVHQRGQQPAGESSPKNVSPKDINKDKPEHKSELNPGVKPTPGTSPVSASPPEAAMPKATSVALGDKSKPAATASDIQLGKEAPAAPDPPAAAEEA